MFLIESLTVCLHIITKFEQLPLTFSLKTQISLPHLLHIFLKFLHLIYFSGIFGCFCTFQRLLHFITSYWPNVLLVGQNALSCGSNKQALPPRHFSDDQNTLTCWELLGEKTGRRRREQAGQRGVRRLGEWVTSITKRATSKLANLHINHSDYLYHQHHDEQHDDHQVEHRMRNFVDHHDHHTRLQCHDECHGDDRHDRHHVHHHLVKSLHNLKTC